ncbi:MAG TPA: thymidine phosphorylase [Pirellulales bacterium]|jgi:pyrimidine-nucleoside phosphorylase
MNVLQCIARKRDGEALSADEIDALVRAYATNHIPDYQMSAWAMAVYLRGMNSAETMALTRAMLHSGQTLEADDATPRVDKHSTGGIGDKSSFTIAPLLACCGLHVPMISGRGLGATGGTLDKLESIPGLRTNLSAGEVRDIVRRVGCVITSASAELVPADRKLYALRDVTGTVASIPLITASILSKKLAENLTALVLDVKFGSGAFMKTRGQARALAESLVNMAARLGLRTTALLTAMNQPNGRLAGNAVEIDEALETLAGGGPADMRELSLALAGEIIVARELAPGPAAAQLLLADHLDSGRALEKFRQMVTAQGGNLDAPRRRAPTWPLTATDSGFIKSIDAERLGLAIVELGGGRKKLGDPVDHSVGIEILVRLGDPIVAGQPLLNIFAEARVRDGCLPLLQDCFQIGSQAPVIEPLIAERIVATAEQDNGRSADD